MTPNVDDRLASVIRALTEVVLPHLPLRRRPNST